MERLKEIVFDGWSFTFMFNMKTDKLITIWMIDDNEHNKENESISSLLDS